MPAMETRLSWRAYHALLKDTLDAQFEDAQEPEKAPPRWALQLILKCQWTAWVYKRFRLGDPIHFEVDGQRLRRQSRMGVKDILWSDVIDARRLLSGWLFRLPQGTLGICAEGLSGTQRQQFESAVPATLWRSA